MIGTLYKTLRENLERTAPFLVVDNIGNLNRTRGLQSSASIRIGKSEHRFEFGYKAGVLN
jgi:hypothetical protein